MDIPERIETARLVLEATRRHHVQETYPVVQDSLMELKLWMPWAASGSNWEEMAIYFAKAHAQWISRELLDFQWYHKASGALVGKGGLHHIDWDIPKFEMGYWPSTSLAKTASALTASPAYPWPTNRVLSQYPISNLGMSQSM